MAYPRVFISSTCYDLREIRDVLFSFIEEMNYLPVLSDKGDVFYHPDIHTHDSCLNEIETCQLFILIIGGRFGGKYKTDPKKSIVNAEYEAAKKLNIPIVTFISREVYEDHRVYVKNKKENGTTVKKILYPSIDKQNYAMNIFEFIDDVRSSEYNNAVFPFEFGREIRKSLKQQWAGMFYEFLRSRTANKQIEKTNKLLSDLTLIGEKTEEILNKVYKSVDKQNANKEINTTGAFFDGKKFILTLMKQYPTLAIKQKNITKFITFDKRLSFEQFLLSTGEFVKEADSYPDENRNFNVICQNKRDPGYWIMISGDLLDGDKLILKKYEKLYASYRSLSPTERKKIIESVNL